MNTSMKIRAKRVYRWGTAFGLDPQRTYHSSKQLTGFRKDAQDFRSQGGRIDSYSPQLSDQTDDAGHVDGHYFWQDLLVAQRIAGRSPARHVDLGSRIDGFVAHLLAFREVEVIDIRDLTSTVPGLTFLRADGMSLEGIDDQSLESFSSLHAIEHFGLGRYGDPIDPSGHIHGMSSVQRVLAPGGRCYISFPVGPEAVEFNAQRVIDPRQPIDTMDELELVDFTAIPWSGSPVMDAKPADYVDQQGWCGLYEFRRPS